MSSKPLVSIIIPCKDVDSYTRQCIEYCKRLEYSNFEIILLPDCPSKTIDGVVIIATGTVPPGVKRNIGVKNSTGEFCAFIDNDAYPRSDWLTNAVKCFENPEVAGVGGPGLTPRATVLCKKLEATFCHHSWLVTYRAGIKQKVVSSQMTYTHVISSSEKQSSKKLADGTRNTGLAKTHLMCLAIKRLGKKLVESSDVVVYHHRRPLFSPHLKQVSRFGEHRGFFVKKFPENSVKLTYFFPSLLVFSLLVGIVISLFFSFFAYVVLFGVVAYLVSSLIASALQVRNVKLLLSVWLGIIVTHIVYGSFFLSGLAKRDLKR